MIDREDLAEALFGISAVGLLFSIISGGVLLQIFGDVVKKPAFFVMLGFGIILIVSYLISGPSRKWWMDRD